MAAKLDDTLRAFLRQPLVARVTTLDPDGYPHTVPIWFILDGDDLVMATPPGSRKIRNIGLNPKGAVTIGGDSTDDEAIYQTGYLFQGDLTVERDPEGMWLTRITYHYRQDRARADRDMAEWGPHDAIRLRIKTVIKVM